LKEYTAAELIQFEDEIAELFNNAQIKAPIHLYYGNEDEMIRIFQNIHPQDWVFCSWRSHYQCLLKGVPSEQLKQEILSGHSISLCFPEQRVYSSAIVGGNLLIAVGTALALRRQKLEAMVYCFIGEMTSESGIAHECIKYSRQHQLPIHFVVEDNGKSVLTDTRATWKLEQLTYQDTKDSMITYYHYETKYPHAGAGVRVQF
jgi:pyruvate dehydrogenase E1 component alpha subunit